MATEAASIALVPPSSSRLNLAVVYGRHTFIPEEMDEIDFKVGEPIVVLERDEEFNDGWFRGQNIRGRIGLFPENFTTAENLLQVDEDTISALLESANSYSHSSSNNNNPATEDDDNDEDIVEYETGDSHYQTVREDHHPRTTTEETSIVVIDENNNAAVAGDAAEVILQSEEDRQIDEEMDKLEEAVRLEGDDAAASVLMSPNTVSPISTITSSPNTNIVVHSNPETWNSAEIRVWLINNDFERFIDNFKDVMDGSEFMRLNLSNLRVMGIADLSDRINLLHEILVLRDNYKKHAPPPPPSPSSPLSPSGTVSSSSSSLRDSPHSSSPPPPVIRVPGVSITRLRDHEEERAAAASNDNVDDGNNNVSQWQSQRLKHAVSEFTLSDYLYSSNGAGGVRVSQNNTIISEDDKPLGVRAQEMANNNNDQEVDQATDSNYNNATAKASSSSPKKSPGIAFGFAGKKNLVSSAVSSVTKLARKISQKTRATVVIAAPTAVSSTTTAPSTKTTTKTATKNTSATSLSPIDEESIDATLIDPHSLKNAEFSGSLFIRMGNEKMWKKRWCALDEGTLYILKDEEALKYIAAIPLVAESYQIQPASNQYFKTQFTFKAESTNSTTTSSASASNRPIVYMGADTQLSMVSWINVLVRAIQKVQRTGPMHLIPIKQKHPEIIRIESLSLDNHQHPSQGSGLYEVSAAEVVDGLLMEEEEMPMSPPPLVNQTPSSSPTPNTTLRSASSSSSSSVHSSSGDNSSSRFVVPGNSRSFDDYFVPSTEKRAAGGDLVRRPTWATTNMMPAAKYYVSSEPPARKSLDNQHYRREDSWGRSSSAPYNVEEMTGILRARTTIGPDHPRNQFQQQHLFDSSSDTRRASNDGF